MSTVALVLLILFAVYVMIFYAVRRSPRLQERGVVTWGPVIMLRTPWGLRMMDRMARHTRFWRIMGRVSMTVSFALMAVIAVILIIDLIFLPQAMQSDGLGIEYALAIPGLNPMLPLVYGIIGLVVAMVIHELAHGIQSRANGVGVEHSGLQYCVIPLGAFVELNSDDIEKAPRRARMDIFAAGITTNFLAAVALFAVMFAALSAGVTSEYADMPAVYAVSDGSEAYGSGIPTSAVICDVDGEEVTDYASFESILREKASTDVLTCTVGYVYKDVRYEKVLHLGAQVEAVVSVSPAYAIGLDKGMFVTGIGKAREAMQPVVVPSDFTSFMQTTSSGETIAVRYFDGTGHHTREVVLSSSGSVGYLGISTSLSGFTFTTPDMVLQEGINPLNGADSISSGAVSLLSYISAPLNGFSPVPQDVTWWYDCTFMPDEAFWVLIYVIYWIFWLNIVLAISNALPGLPFDGGHLFRGGVDWVLERAGRKTQEERDRIADPVCAMVTYAMLGIMLLVVIAVVF